MEKKKKNRHDESRKLDKQTNKQTNKQKPTKKPNPNLSQFMKVSGHTHFSRHHKHKTKNKRKKITFEPFERSDDGFRLFLLFF